MRAVWIGAVALLAGCAVPAPRSAPVEDRTAVEAALMRHIAILAGDDFGGRQPGTEGEAKTLRYLAREWQAAGLESGTNDPANPWFAPVDLARATPALSVARFYREGRPVALPQGGAVVFTTGARGLVQRAPVVFVGMAGDALDGASVAGRVVLMMGDHSGQSEQREALVDAGAAAVLSIVRDPAQFAELVAARRRGSHRLASGEEAGPIDGYISRDAFAALAGARSQELLAQAGEPGFRTVALPLSATLEATAAPGRVRTHNLIARLPGQRPGAGAVLLMAHWDHFGQCGEPSAADRICNGAVDNASGLAVLTELAKRTAAGPKLERDVYFLATTAEEWGLLGAQAFADNPPLPLDAIVAAFNLDSVAVAPAGSAVAVVGSGLTPLDAGIAQVIAQAGRRLAEGGAAQGYLRRQDGWALLRRDVPAVSVSSAFAVPGVLARFNRERYHLPGDEADGIELGGAAEDLALHVALVRHFADPTRWPGVPGKSPPITP